MKSHDIANLRLTAQLITPHDAISPGELVSQLVAMQAQDYAGALWSIGLRLPGLTRADIEQAILERQIVRTWPMRGTLHFVASEDIHWLLKLLTPRVISSIAARYRQLELDDATFLQSRKLITKALEGNKILTRNELLEVLNQGGISTEGQRGIHILGRLSQEQLLCFGPHQGKQPTFVLLDEWIPTHKDLQRDEALQSLTERYFTSHGPATLKDFVGWAGLKITEARLGLELAGNTLQKITIEGIDYWLSAKVDPELQPSTQTYLLAGFDEFMLGYKDRSAALPTQYSNLICPGNNGVFYPTIVIDGQVSGTWKSSLKARSCLITPQTFYELSQNQKKAIDVAASPYASFIEKPVMVGWPDN